MKKLLSKIEWIAVEDAIPDEDMPVLLAWDETSKFNEEYDRTRETFVLSKKTSVMYSAGELLRIGEGLVWAYYGGDRLDLLSEDGSICAPTHWANWPSLPVA